MSVDHDRLDEIFEGFKKLKDDDIDAAGKLFLEFKTGLLQHINWEEDILFPVFEQKTGIHDTGPTAIMRRKPACWKFWGRTTRKKKIFFTR